jgi:anti-sigma regulatory factor (Ser/Thr protein kinase)
MTSGPAGEIRLKADLRAPEKVRDFVKDILDRFVLTDEERFKIELSLHEICINIVLHAYPRKKGPLVIRAWTKGDRAYFEFTDEGIAFDPRGAVLPDLRAKLESGRRGGYGIFLYRTLMDGFVYRREDGRNVLTVFKKARPAPARRSV